MIFTDVVKHEIRNTLDFGLSNTGDHLKFMKIYENLNDRAQRTGA